MFYHLLHRFFGIRDRAQQIALNRGSVSNQIRELKVQNP